jgi:hypothetical protein
VREGRKTILEIQFLFMKKHKAPTACLYSVNGLAGIKSKCHE